MGAKEADDSFALLRRLADGAVHSGTELGLGLGISRAAIWRRISKLADLGYQVNRIHAKGYQLEMPLELLAEDRIRAVFPLGDNKYRIIIRETVESTNQQAIELIRSGECSVGTALLAEYQTRGRGRRGRNWASPFGRNLYCSIVWAFEGGISALAGLSLVAGLAVVRVLRRDFGVDAMLKWPNDILIGDAKLGGILVEIDGDFGGPVSAVVGIGLNVDMPAELAAGITQPWVDLNSLYGMAVSRNQLAAKVIMSCHEVFSGLSDSSFSIFKDEWNSLHALQGQHVSTEAGGQVLLGVACGVDDTGALLIDSDGVVHRVVGGEVTVRRIQ